MQLMICPIGNEDGPETVSLYHWLSKDAAVTGCVHLAVEPSSGQPGAMGGGFDVISAVFADGSAVAAIGSLLVAYRTWRDTRQVPPPLKIEKDGVTVVVSAGSEQEVRHVLERMLHGASSEQLAKSGEDVKGS